MKKNMFFWIMALMICAAVGCTDNSTYEPEKLPAPKKLSHEVTQAEARQSLEKIIANMTTSATRSGEQKSLPPITSVYTTGKPAVETRVGEDVEPYFHIFNFGDNEGFAIMSGDDRVEPLLALTFSGELTPETDIDNPGFEIAYSKMEDYYVAKTMSGPSVNPDIPIPPKDSFPTSIVEDSTYYFPMKFGYCPVKWGQGEPYNTYCTITVDGVTKPAPTGCVTVAVAQLMAIYKYPDSYYYHPNNEAATFNWDEMTNHPLSDAGINKIDSLMYLLGKPYNLCVIYGEETSTAFANDIPRTLEAFGYSNGGDWVNYNTDKVVNELKEGYPVLIGGKRLKENGEISGHRWLGHGLMKLISTHKLYRFPNGWITLDPPFESYYILCNWGWYGKADGYYLSNVFNVANGAVYPDPIYPNDSTINYNYQYDIDVVMNIRK